MRRRYNDNISRQEDISFDKIEEMSILNKHLNRNNESFSELNSCIDDSEQSDRIFRQFSRTNSVTSLTKTDLNEFSDSDEILDVTEMRDLLISVKNLKSTTVSLAEIIGKLNTFWTFAYTLLMALMGIPSITIFLAVFICCITSLVNEFFYYKYIDVIEYLRLNILVTIFMILVMIVWVGAPASLCIIDDLIWPNNFKSHLYNIYNIIT
ncbi:hypothetical protein EDEG_00793 [Edhazardia aedis USNM 41457]|uniref:Uncharacterized protein n=1 Tax=Edhazardia aedis (strain USNM 41457) TaxID=1003232 RepID=J8ZZR3_EDHAE|nr:hypothetical protein EDEG_00793 [Edhazardia aedis USNM 41457]|eukprot:EJW05123.1 hypothetical protein EDEG_00793 [Edhazardia aedis USNM 41457]